jgi:hypothetical protein
MPIGVRGADFVPFSATDFNQWLQGIFIAAKNLWSDPLRFFASLKMT